MNLKIKPSKLSGSVRAIPSKAQAQRVFICAALSDRPMEINAYGISGDVEAVIACLRAMGAKVRQIRDGRWRVEPVFKKNGGKAFSGVPVLKCRESKAALRFLLPVGAALFNRLELEASGGHPFERIEPLVKAMEANGCHFSGETFPMSVQGRLRGGNFLLSGNVSDRFVSGLLMAAPFMKDDSRVLLDTYLESEYYVDLTIDVMERFGIAVYENEAGYEIPGRQTYCSPKEFRVEGDWTTAAYWMGARALGQDIKVEGLNHHSAQGDRRVVRLLEDLGEGAVIDAFYVSDLVPILSVVAAVSEGQTRISRAQRLRQKGNDRLRAVTEMLRALGADVKESEEELLITGKPVLSGGTVDCSEDELIAMAAAVASTVCSGPVELRGAEAVKKIYPRFFKDFKHLGGVYEDLDASEHAAEIAENEENEENAKSVADTVSEQE